MKRWFWKRWIWAVVVCATAAAGLSVAQRGTDAPPSPPKAGDVITLKFRDGPDRQVKVLKSERQPDGSYLSEVKDAKTGETFTLVDRPGDAPAKPRAGSADKTAPKLPEFPKAKPRANDPLLPPAKDTTPEPAKEKRGFGNGALLSVFGKSSDPDTPNTTEPEERPGLLKRIFGRNKDRDKDPSPPPATTSGRSANPYPAASPALHPSLRPAPGTTVAPSVRATNEPPRSYTPRPITPPNPVVPAPVRIPTAPPAPSAEKPVRPVPVVPPVTRPVVPPQSEPAPVVPPVTSTPVVPPTTTPVVPPVPSTPVVPPVPTAPPASSVPALPALPAPPAPPAVPSVPTAPPAVPAPGNLPPIPVPPGGVSAAPTTPANAVQTAAHVATPAGESANVLVVPGDHSTPGGRAMMKDIQPHVAELQTADAPSRRALAARALAGGRHGSTDAVKAVIFHVAQHDPAGLVRAVCIEELCKLGYHDPSFLAYLHKACDDSSAEVKAAAKDAVAKLSPRK